MKHILIISHNYPYEFDHTFGFFCKNQADALIAVHQKVGVICPLAYSMKYVAKYKKLLWGRSDQTENGITSKIFFFPSIPKAKWIRYGLTRYLGKKLVDQYVREYGKPDIIHLHVYKGAEVAEYAARKYNIPLVWTEHFTEINSNQLNSYEWSTLKSIARNANIRLAVSEDFRSMLEKLLQVKFEYLPNVYDSKVFTYTERKTSSSQPFQFIHVAHINARKNQQRLLKAFELAFKGNKNVMLKIIGAGAASSHFANIIEQHELKDQVQVFDSLSSIAIKQHFENADAFVLSSDYETFGVSLIEAMACGLPAISTRCGGPQSIITEPALGILADLEAEALAEAMIKMHANIGEYDRKLIADHVYSKYSFEAIGTSLMKIYDRCER